MNSNLLLLDYDGTLAPLVEQRDQAFPYPGVVERIEQLMKDPNQNVVIITGRTPKEILSLLNCSPMPDIFGNHGLEFFSQGVTQKLPLSSEAASILEKAYTIACRLLSNEEVEKKDFSVAVHYRKHPELQTVIEQELLPKWETLCQKLFHVAPFHAGYELRLKGYGKQTAIRQLLAKKDWDQIAYLGDDQTDEDAFQELGNRGYKLLINNGKPRQTLADTVLTAPEGLLSFLDDWIKNGQLCKVQKKD